MAVWSLDFSNKMLDYSFLIYKLIIMHDLSITKFNYSSKTIPVPFVPFKKNFLSIILKGKKVKHQKMNLLAWFLYK